MSPATISRPLRWSPALKTLTVWSVWLGCGSQSWAIVSAWMRWMSPDFALILARWISQSSSAGEGIR